MKRFAGSAAWTSQDEPGGDDTFRNGIAVIGCIVMPSLHVVAGLVPATVRLCARPVREVQVRPRKDP